jgi:hypothetical protein
MAVQTPNDGSIVAEPPFSRRSRLELVGASGPDIQFIPGALEAISDTSALAPDGGDEETRTPDPLLAKEMLCQLSYVPGAAREWWATLDSNQ